MSFLPAPAPSAVFPLPASAQAVLRPLVWLASFTAADRDRWVSVVCAGGFALLMWVDWLAA